MTAVGKSKNKRKKPAGCQRYKGQEKKTANSEHLAPFYVVLRIFKPPNPCYRGSFSYDDAHTTIGRDFLPGGIFTPRPQPLIPRH
jgi:hypothetical protein